VQPLTLVGTGGMRCYQTPRAGISGSTRIHWSPEPLIASPDQPATPAGSAGISAKCRYMTPQRLELAVRTCVAQWRGARSIT